MKRDQRRKELKRARYERSRRKKVFRFVAVDWAEGRDMNMVMTREVRAFWHRCCYPLEYISNLNAITGVARLDPVSVDGAINPDCDGTQRTSTSNAAETTEVNTP